MKWWVSLIIGSASAAVGFFCGMMYEKNKVAEAITEPPKANSEHSERTIRVRHIRNAKDIHRAMYEDVMKQENYIPNDNQTDDSFDIDAAADEIDRTLAGMESPSEPAFPHIISEDEWRANPYEYSQDNLCFYAQDEMLSDLEGNLVDDPDGLIGEDNVQYLSDHTDWLELYIVNDELETMYRIDRIEASYSEVYG